MAQLRGVAIDSSGDAQDGVSVTIKDNTGSTATIYSERTLTTTDSNPLTTDSNGEWECFVPAAEAYVASYGSPVSRDITMPAPGVTKGVRVIRDTSSQSIGSGSPVKVQYNSASSGYDLTFDTSTNYRFTVPWDGIWEVNASIHIQSLADGDILEIHIYTDGSKTETAQVIMAAAGSGSVDISSSLQLSANQYIEIYAEHDNGSAKNLSADGILCYCTISGQR